MLLYMAIYGHIHTKIRIWRVWICILGAWTHIWGVWTYILGVWTCILGAKKVYLFDLSKDIFLEVQNETCS